MMNNSFIAEEIFKALLETTYDALDDSATALFYYEKALEIQKNSSVLNDPLLATVHVSISKT